jgi:excisionase family DNA binding protein
MDESDSPTSLGRFLTIADTAEELNISVSQAYALARSGELPAIRIGVHGHWRIERSVLESYIEALYEGARRQGLWRQSEYANVSELSIGSLGRSPTSGL